MKRTKPQTHVRVYLTDKNALQAYMKRNKIKSQAEAIKRIFRRVGL